jgi:UDP-GlcNAc:undecaprenyl-phosphate GlcNAc-1-phosphate transferase
LAKRFNLVDQPDNKRKVHSRPIPRVGGIALAAAYFGSLLTMALLNLYNWFHVGSQFGAVRSIAPACFVVFLIGLADDIFNLKPWHKFSGQILAAAMVVSTGVHIHGLGNLPAHSLLEVAGTIIWLVACTNAVNLIDGLDGLAGGISFLATTTILIASLIQGDTGLTLATAPLAGALLGFLIFNFNPASIFLGDSGSLLLGFLIGCYSLLWSGSFASVLDMAAPLVALAVPLGDTTLAIVRRFLHGQPIFKADRGHIHHRLLSRGLTHRRTVLALYLVAAVSGILSLGLIVTRAQWEGVVLAIFIALMLVGIRELRYVEFDALRRVIFPRNIKQEFATHLVTESLKESLVTAQTAEDCWTLVQNGCQEFGFRATRMQLEEQVFYGASFGGSRQSCAMHLLISERSWIELSFQPGPTGYLPAIAPFADILRTTLAEKHFSEDAAHLSPRFSPVLYEAHRTPAA